MFQPLPGHGPTTSGFAPTASSVPVPLSAAATASLLPGLGGWKVSDRAMTNFARPSTWLTWEIPCFVYAWPGSLQPQDVDGVQNLAFTALVSPLWIHVIWCKFPEVLCQSSPAKTKLFLNISCQTPKITIYKYWNLFWSIAKTFFFFFGFPGYFNKGPRNVSHVSVFNCYTSQLAVYFKSFLKKAEQDSHCTRTVFTRKNPLFEKRPEHCLEKETGRGVPAFDFSYSFFPFFRSAYLENFFA